MKILEFDFRSSFDKALLSTAHKFVSASLLLTCVNITCCALKFTNTVDHLSQIGKE